MAFILKFSNRLEKKIVKKPDEERGDGTLRHEKNSDLAVGARFRQG